MIISYHLRHSYRVSSIFHGVVRGRRSRALVVITDVEYNNVDVGDFHRMITLSAAEPTGRATPGRVLSASSLSMSLIAFTS